MANFGQYIEVMIYKALTRAIKDSGLTGGSGGPGGPSEGAMEQAAKAGADQLVNDMSIGAAGGLFGFLRNIPFFGHAIGGLLDPLGELFGTAGDFIEGIALGYGIGAVTGEAIQPLAASVVYSAHRKAGDGRFDPDTAADLWAKGILKQDEAQHEMADQGFGPTPDPSDPFQNLGREGQLRQSKLVYPSPGMLIELLRRKVIVPEDYALAMQRQGYQTQQQGWIQALSRTLLSPADLALANLRGWLDDKPAHDYANELGMTNEDFDVLLANTGEPPGLMQLLEMQRRNVLPPGRLERGIRQSRYRNEWIPYIEAIITGPMSVSDAVNAVVQHHLDFDTAKGYAVQNGLDPDHFKTLVENHGRPLSRTEMSSLVHRGKATDQDFLQAMAESDLKDKSDQSGYNYRQGALDLARTLIPARQITTAIQHGALGRADGIAYLMMQGYTQADAGILVDTGLAEHKATLKELTRSDIQALYTDKLITHQEAKAKLVLLGYDDATADELLALADAKHTAALARTLITQVKALYAKGELTREQAIRRLIDGGVVNENARAQVDEWDILHSVPSRTLTEAQTMKAAEDGIIGIIEAAQRLVGMGYTRHDATVLLQTAGLVTYDSHIKQGWQPVRPGALFDGGDTQTGGLGGDTQTGGLVP